MSRTAQDIALQLFSVQKVHRLGNIHHHHVDCNGAMGLSKMVRTVRMEQNQRSMSVGSTMNQALWSKYGIRVLGQVHASRHVTAPVFQYYSQE